MVGLVNKRIAAFEEMARTETVKVKQFPVPKYFVGRLISFYEPGVPAIVGEAAHNAQVVSPVDEASGAPTIPSRSSSYQTARSHFEENGFSHNGPRSEASQDGGPQEIVAAGDEDEGIRLRRSRFAFHINAPATNIGEAIARAQRRRGLPRAKFFLARGIRILQNAVERRPAGSPAREDSQRSRGKKSTVRNTGGIKIFPRRLANTDPSTSIVTPAGSENGNGSSTGLGVQAEETKIIIGKRKVSPPANSTSKRASQLSTGETFFAKNIRTIPKIPETNGTALSPGNGGIVRKTIKKEGKKVSFGHTENVRKTTNAEGKESPAMNTGSASNTATMDGRESSENAGCIRKIPAVKRAPTVNTGNMHHTMKKEDKMPTTENVGSARKNTMTGGKKSPSTNKGSASKNTHADATGTPTANMESSRRTTKEEGKKYPLENTESVLKSTKTDGRKTFLANRTGARKPAKTDQSTSTVTQTRSEVGDDGRNGLGREVGRRKTSLFLRLHANLRGRRERRQSFQRSTVVHQFSRRVAGKGTTTIPIEVNIPYPKGATESGESFAATIHLKVLLTRENE